MKINPYKNAALAMSRAVADDSILTQLKERSGAKAPPVEPEPEQEEAAPEEPAAEELQPEAGGESGGSGLSAVARLEQSFTPRSKRIVALGEKSRGEREEKHNRKK